MAEQEVIKHTKKIYKLWNGKEHAVWHKIREFMVEMFIIIFAVSISIWFHNWSEHRHEQADVKKFLLGLRSDLSNDIKEMTEDISSYQMQSRIFNYLTSRKLGDSLSVDTLRKYSNFLYNTTGLVPNNGRFEGFKSSGKIGKIENDELQNNIMDLYQEDIPSLISSTTYYVEAKKVFFHFVQLNVKRTSDSTNNIRSVLKMDEGLNKCAPLANTSQIIERYMNCINKMKAINGDIEKEYDLEAIGN